MKESPANTSLLVYDGDCGFCRYCVDYARALGAPALEFEPFQDAAPRYPHISLEEFRAAVQLFEPDGRHTRGAEASFRVLALAGRPLASRLYDRVPGAGIVSEAAYRLVAAHRATCLFICRLLFGKELRPATHALVTAVFLRLLGLVVIAAFASFHVQAPGLIGSAGIAPVQALLDGVRANAGSVPWTRFPTLLWLDAGDTTIRALCWAGIAGGVALAMGLRSRLLLLALYGLYLSLVLGGQLFMSYQWDTLLLESLLNAFLLLAWPWLGLWACRFLLARFLFEAGWAKLASADPTWADWSALRYHFETQPLPTPLAWYAHHAPPALLEAGSAATLAIEILLPVLVFTPRRVRLIPLAAFVLLQLAILLTGNYNFFNLLVLLLCLVLLDDRQLGALLPARMVRGLALRRTPAPTGIVSRGAALALVAVIATVSFVQLGQRVFDRDIEGWRLALLRTTEPWMLCNPYGLFASMTTQRPEIELQGSADGVHWKNYVLPWKPGDPQRASRWNFPHQPRLDWQFWFAALQPDTVQPWFYNLAFRLLSGSAPVQALFATDPFPASPPTYLRARLWLYRFSTPAERAAGAGPWQRELLGDYLPVSSLRATGSPADGQ